MLENMRRHLRGHSCPLCEQAQRVDGRKNDFLKQARERHGGKYDYSKFEYKGATIRSVIICREHGEFQQSPSRHLNSIRGCPACSNDSRRQLLTAQNRRPMKEFIAKARDVHDSKYSYDSEWNLSGNTSLMMMKSGFYTMISALWAGVLSRSVSSSIKGSNTSKMSRLEQEIECHSWMR